MKKSNLITAIFFLGFCAVYCSSCKKSHPINGKVKQQTYWHQFSDTTIIDTLSYTYDRQGRVVSIQHASGNETYSYGNGSLTHTLVSGTTIIEVLDSRGLVISTSDGYTYSYDENGYLIHQSGPLLSDNYAIYNGNIVSDSQTYNGNPSIEEYSYLNTLDYRDFGRPFQGKSGRNLVLRDSLLGASASNITYTFDNLGRVSTETESGNGILFISKYSYFD